MVVVTSTSGISGNIGQANYAAARVGLIGLGNTLALEGHRYGILANAVSPVAPTRMTVDTAPPDVLAGLSSAHVASVVGYLLSDECTETGGTFVVGGGELRRIAYFQSPTARFPTVRTMEDVALAWPDVTDLSAPVPAV